MSEKNQSIKFRPLQDRVLLKRVDIEPQMRGGIVLPDTSKKKPETAKVLAVGPGKQSQDGQMIPVPVKVGDIVLINKYSGQEVSIDGEELLIASSNDLIAIVEQ